MQNVWLHLDLDAFYASVEQLDNPEYRGRPVIVGQGKRGVVSACSYEARRFGVRSAMPVAQAEKLCPDGIFLPVRMQRYQEISRAIMLHLYDFTPELQQISVDEAFLNLSGTERLLGPVEASARRIKTQVRDQFGLCCSVGIAETKFLAKLASDYKKPDGLYRVLPGEEQPFVDTLELSDLFGVGKRTVQLLEGLGVHSPLQLRKFRPEELRGYFGPSTGEYLYQVARGIDPGIYSGGAEDRSISHETTFETDLRDSQALRSVLLELCQAVFFRVAKLELSGAVIFIKLRTNDFLTRSARHTLSRPVVSLDLFYHECLRLVEKAWDGSPLRLVGVGIGGLHSIGEDRQLDLFSDKSDKSARVDAAVAELHKRYGTEEVVRARLVKPRRPSGG
ncbi:MAG: DNA polymerase IV [Spirochaetia bacterium]